MIARKEKSSAKSTLYLRDKHHAEKEKKYTNRVTTAQIWTKYDYSDCIATCPTSVVDPWHIGTDPDPDPAYFVSGWQDTMA